MSFEVSFVRPFKVPAGRRHGKGTRGPATISQYQCLLFLAHEQVHATHFNVKGAEAIADLIRDDP